jgi:putative membrane protein
MAQPHWSEQGNAPDYRFSLANERTFLAWIRTALAMLAGAVLLHEFASRLQPAWVPGVLSIALVLLAALLSAGAYWRWRGNEIAMRLSAPLPYSSLLIVLAGSVLALSFTVALVLLRQ